MLGNIVGEIMSYIKGIIQEEYQRLQELSVKYANEIMSFPKGTISIKKRNSNKYLYLAIRQQGKVKFQYIGSINSESALNMLEKMKLRREFEAKLKQVEADLKEIKKVINGRKI